MTLRPLATIGLGAAAGIGGGLMGVLAWWLGAPALVSIPLILSLSKDGVAIGFTLGALYGAML